MPFQTKYLFSASMDVEPEKEALFNEVYDTEHIPFLSAVPGVVAAARFALADLVMVMGGQRRYMKAEGEPKYSTMYQIESPDVLTSAAWSEAARRGRFMRDVLPQAKNLRLVLWKLVMAEQKAEAAASPRAGYLFSARMDVEPDKEALFNEVYDTEHIPYLMEVPGVISVTRFQTQDFRRVSGGQTQTMPPKDEPKYNALYELESPDVLTSPAWAKVVDAGRWPGEVRPHTKNRRHVLRKRISPAD